MPVRQHPQHQTWFFRFTYKGKSYFQGGYRTASLAKSAEASCRDKIEKETLFPELKSQSILFKDAVEWYLSTHSINKRTGYIDRARLGLAAKFFENKTVSTVTSEDVGDFLGSLPKKLSDLTRNHYLAVLRALFNRLNTHGKWKGENPAKLVDFKKVPKARVRFLYPAEEKMLTLIVKNEPDLWGYYYIALHTGLRIRELMAIRVKDVDLILGHIFIPNSKNSKSRYAPLSPSMVSFVSLLAKGKDQEATLLANWSYTYLRRHFKSCCEIAGISNLKIHDLRHTFAQRLLAKGESIYLVSKLLGHSSVNVTASHYGHLATADLSKTINGIDGAFSCTQLAQSPVEMGAVIQ